jgi:uncharacterized protein YjcR
MNAPVAPSTDPRNDARLLYWQGWAVADIARKIGENPATVHSWKRRDDWDSSPVVQRVEVALEARIIQLVTKEEKTEGDLRELEALAKSLERTARIRKYDQGGNEADLNPKLKNRNRGKKRQPVKNELTDEQVEALRKDFHDNLFGYQREWYDAGLLHRIRNLLKSRQIGATWYFAREAFIDALDTGRNQIFLSASKAQAYVFRAYIRQWVQEITGVDLKGDPIELWNGATLYFLATSSRTAQSYHGNVYMDEYFWIPRFQEFRKVASGMAMHKKWRLTYFSTPSTVAHEAYPFWTGEQFNRGRPKKDHIQLDVSHKALKDGRLCADGQWRQMVTVEDAVERGCDLFDLDQLRMEYNEQDYRNLLMCEFVDDTQAIFTLSKLQRCMVDAWERWEDFKPFAPHPIGERGVWVGFDPSRVRDGASVIIVAPPVVDGGKYRVLEKYTWHNMSFPDQAEEIRKITRRYHVSHLEIDCTGPGGLGTADLVAEFYPAVRRIQYSPQVKTVMVAKTLNIIDNARLEYDTGWKDLTMAMMAIRKSLTPNGGQVTYTSGRSEEHGHADLAWALMHALDASKITAGGDTGRGSTVEIF